MRLNLDLGLKIKLLVVVADDKVLGNNTNVFVIIEAVNNVDSYSKTNKGNEAISEGINDTHLAAPACVGVVYFHISVCISISLQQDRSTSRYLSRKLCNNWQRIYFFPAGCAKNTRG